MSTGRGRSWRPEKSRRVRGARRRQVLFIGTLLSVLVAGFLYLIFRPRVPLLHYSSVFEQDFEADPTMAIPLSNLSAATNVVELQNTLSLLRDRNASLISTPAGPFSFADFLQSGFASVEPGEKLVLYLAADAWVVPGDDSSNPPATEFLAGRAGAVPVRWTEILQRLKSLSAGQIVVLLELGNRQPGFSSGILGNDLLPVLSAEVENSGVPDLTVIVSCDSGERSWEFFASSAVDNADSAKDKSAVAPSGLSGQFHGTVFGHFVNEAFMAGKTSTADELFQFVRTGVASWVDSNVGEKQTVQKLTGSNKASDKELLARALLPSRMDLPASVKEKVQAAASPEAKQGEGQGDTPAKKADPAVETETPAAKLSALLAIRDQISEAGMVPVIVPVEWQRLQSMLMAAEKCLLNEDLSDFRQLHDQCRSLMQKLKDQELVTLSLQGREKVIQWVNPPQTVTDADRVLFQGVLESFRTSADKVPSLPVELRVKGRARQAFVTWFMNDLADIAGKMSGLAPEDVQKRMNAPVKFIQTMKDAGWPAEELPHQFSSLRDVFTGNDAAWHSAVLADLLKLIQLRSETLQIASGTLNDGRLMRRLVWEQSREAVLQILRRLTVAERWLTAGPAGLLLAKDRLNSAEEQLQLLRSDVSGFHELTTVEDGQLEKTMWLIQYLAYQQEQVVLAPEERKSVLRMAAAAIEGQDIESHFPQGQLDTIGFRREHLSAMFALTRNFAEKPVDASDLQRLSLLRGYLNDRVVKQVSAAERRRLLEIPVLSQRQELLAGLNRTGRQASRSGSDGLSNSGVWYSFWSIRLAMAAAPEAEGVSQLWSLWKDFVEALDGADNDAVIRSRTKLAHQLRDTWIAVAKSRSNAEQDKIFASLDQITALVARDVQGRLDASRNGVYEVIERELTGSSHSSAFVEMSLENDKLELDAENQTQLVVDLKNAAAVYVLQGGMTVSNAGTEIDRNWHRINIPADANEKAVVELRSGSSIREPVTLLAAAVNDWDAVTVIRPLTIYPSSKADWDISFVHADGREMRLSRLEPLANRVRRRLTLLPSTKDMVTGMDTPVPLSFVLRRRSGASSRVSIQLFHLESGIPVWPTPQSLELKPDPAVPGSASVQVSLTAPAPAPAAAAPPATGQPPVIPSLDFSEGFRLDVTPEDVLQKVTTSIEVAFVFSPPEQFVRRPSPQYDHASNTLTLRLDRSIVEDRSALLPAKMPVDVYFSPTLRQYLLPGSAYAFPNLLPDGQELRFQFSPDIERSDNTGKEFALRLAGIPYPWRWRLTNGNPVLIDAGDEPAVRVDLQVLNDAEVKPVQVVPELLIGEAWPKARLRADVYLYGAEFNRDWEVGFSVRNRVSDRRIPAADQPIQLRRRYLEQVLVSPGEAGAWNFSTSSTPWSRDGLELQGYGLSDGKYELRAALQNVNDRSVTYDGWADFTVDATSPKEAEIVVDMPGRHNVTLPLTGTVRATDGESGIQAIRVGFDPAMLQNVVLEGVPGRQSGKFVIQPSQGFPELEEQSTEKAREVSLTVEVVNGAGLKTLLKKQVTMFRAARVPPPSTEPPGGIEVKFPGSNPFDFIVSVRGKTKGKFDSKTGKRVVSFSNLPPDSYGVDWVTKGGLSAGKTTVTVKSGETVPVEVDKVAK